MDFGSVQGRFAKDIAASRIRPGCVGVKGLPASCEKMPPWTNGGGSPSIRPGGAVTELSAVYLPGLAKVKGPPAEGPAFFLPAFCRRVPAWVLFVLVLVWGPAYNPFSGPV